MASIFSIDGIDFNVGVTSLKREAPVVDRSAERTIGDGVLHRVVLGTYFNYSLSISTKDLDFAEYEKLYNKVVEPVPYHNITVPTTVGTMTYQAYISGVSDELIKIQNGKNLWSNLQIKFIAVAPSLFG